MSPRQNHALHYSTPEASLMARNTWHVIKTRVLSWVPFSQRFLCHDTLALEGTYAWATWGANHRCHAWCT